MSRATEKRKRLDPALFDLPVERIRSGWYTDKYFLRSKEILERDNHRAITQMQIFNKKEGILCGVDEAIAVVRLCADRPEELTIMALHDGDCIEPWETVMTIEGDYACYVHLETVYLGIVARRTAMATAMRRVVEAAQGKQILYFGARHDHFSNQPGDGYAAFVGGATGVSTDANAAWWQAEGLGTVPHGLIAAYGGDTVKACIAFDKYMPEEVGRIALVDFDNDSAQTSLAVARALKDRLWGVRLDTSERLIDESVTGVGPDSYGVCPELAWNVRKTLDDNGFQHVKIVVSGGFTAEKIREFIESGVPFDAVGIGSSLFQDRVDFTADVVKLDGKHCAKVGRKFNENPRLEKVEFQM